MNNSLVRQVGASRLLAEIKQHPATVGKGPEFWHRLTANAERVGQIADLHPEFREHIEYVLENPNDKSAVFATPDPEA
jgi:hypothetical protein